MTLTAPAEAADRATRPAAVELRGWGWRHGGRRAFAVRGADLRLEPGERVLLLGPSGAGKSTLLAGLAGLLEPGVGGDEEGVALVDGRPAREARDRVGLLLQDPASQLVMARAGDDVAFGLENRAVEPTRIWPAVDAALASVGFPYGRGALTGALSGGEQQRLALAGVLALAPGLLLLDEPTANLDPDGAALVRTALHRVLADRAVTLVLVEHRLEGVLDLVDRVVVLAPGGGVRADGSPAEVFGRYGDQLAADGVWVPGRAPAPAPAAPRPGPALVTGPRLVAGHPRTGEPLVGPLDVELAAASSLVVTGPNGAGKSTLATLLSGLAAPASGAVCGTAALGGPAGRPLHRWRARDLAGRVGTVFQNPEHQFVAGRVDAELAVGPRRVGLAEAEVRPRVADLLARLRLAHLAAANPYTLSGGEKRRLSVATALATGPRVLVLDEPTFGQDARTWAELVDLVVAQRAAGCAVVVVTHDPALAGVLGEPVLHLAGANS